MPSMKCRHPKNKRIFGGEFNTFEICLNCRMHVEEKKPKKRKPRVTYPLPKCYISTRSGQYKRLEKDSKTLKLIIKYEIALCGWRCDGKLRWSALAKYNGEGNNVHSAVRRAIKLEKK